MRFVRKKLLNAAWNEIRGREAWGELHTGGEAFETFEKVMERLRKRRGKRGLRGLLKEVGEMSFGGVLWVEPVYRISLRNPYDENDILEFEITPGYTKTLEGEIKDVLSEMEINDLLLEIIEEAYRLEKKDASEYERWKFIFKNFLKKFERIKEILKRAQ